MIFERVLMPPLNAIECLDVLIRRAVLFAGIQSRVLDAIPTAWMGNCADLSGQTQRK